MSLSGFANRCATANDWGAVEWEEEAARRGKRLAARGANMAAFDTRTSGDFQMSDVIPGTVKIAVDRLNLAGLRQNQRKKNIRAKPTPQMWRRSQSELMMKRTETQWVQFGDFLRARILSYRSEKLMFAI